jgi:2-methylisocitrate lyase-like PEP mutase family enzyme
MNAASNGQPSAISRFRELHASGCFVLPNPWDVGTAVFLEHLGFKALATTSAGFAFTQGKPDGVRAVSRDAMLAHIRKVVAAAALPVNADFQSGYAHEPEGVAANVALCIATGVAGLSIEDATGDDATPLYEFGLAVERIRAARAAIDASGVPIVLTARCEAWLVGQPDPARRSRSIGIKFLATLGKWSSEGARRSAFRTGCCRSCSDGSRRGRPRGRRSLSRRSGTRRAWLRRSRNLAWP